MDFRDSCLPEVIQSVSEAQKTQANEITSHQQQLKNIQEELCKEYENLSKLTEEKESLSRKILHLEGNCSSLANSCALLQQEIVAVSINNVQLLQETQTFKEEEIMNEKMRSCYRCKMEKHKEICRDHEKASETHQALQEQKHKIQILLNERETLEANPEDTRQLLEGISEQSLKEEIQEIEVTKINLKSNIDRKVKKVEHLREKKAKLKQDITVWDKRNGAQLTRLKKQVLQAQSYNRQWNEQACQLEKTIASLRQQLEE